MRKKAVRDHLNPAVPIDDRSLVDTQVVRVEVKPEQLLVRLAPSQDGESVSAGADTVLSVPWHKPPSRPRRELLLPASVAPQHARPIRSETRATLVAAIARDVRVPVGDSLTRALANVSERIAPAEAARLCVTAARAWADAIERQLAHGERNKVRSAYNSAQHLPERRKMMQAWADYLDELRAAARGASASCRQASLCRSSTRSSKRSIGPKIERRASNEPRHEKRDRGSQRQHNEQAARPEAVDKSELPAFLFRPVPVRKPEPQPE